MRKLLDWRSWSVTFITRLLTLVLAVVVSVAIVVALDAERESYWREVTRIGTDKQVIALAGSKRLEEFLGRIETDLHLLSHTVGEMDLSGERLDRLFEEVMERYEGTPMVDLALTDEEGKSIVAADSRGVREGARVDLSDRAYFKWAEKQKDDSEAYLSEAITSRGGLTEGKMIVVVVVSVIDDEVFDGVMLAAIDLAELIQDYASNLSVYEGSDVALIDDGGVVVAGFMQEDLSGKNIKEVVREHYVGRENEREKVLAELLSGKNSWIELSLDVGDGQNGDEWIVGFSPVEFGGKKLSLVTMVTADEANGRMGGQRFFLRLGLVVAGLGGLTIGLFSIFGMRRAEGLWFERGFYSGQESGKKKKVVGKKTGKK